MPSRHQRPLVLVIACGLLLLLATGAAAQQQPQQDQPQDQPPEAAPVTSSFSRSHVVKYTQHLPPLKPSHASRDEAGAAFSLFTPLTKLAPVQATVAPSDSLTGLPYLMTFQQQLAGGLPVNWFPSWSVPSTASAPAPSAPATPAPSALATRTTAPAPAPAPAPVPAPSGSSSTPTGCSTTDRSPAAVFACANAVRTNPSTWTAHFPCAYSPWLSEVSTPRRPALKADTRLAAAAARQAMNMASTRTVSHVGSDGSTMAQRIAAAGFTTYPQAENVAGGQASALAVVTAWMCSAPHRSTLTSCSLDSVGTATAYDTTGVAYYDQDFGCSSSVTNACHC